MLSFGICAWARDTSTPKIQSKPRTKALGMPFEGGPCFCQTCVLAKMKRMPFLNQGQLDVALKQNISFDVSGPYPLSPDGFIYLMNAICKATGKRWREGQTKIGFSTILDAVRCGIGQHSLTSTQAGNLDFRPWWGRESI